MESNTYMIEIKDDKETLSKADIIIREADQIAILDDESAMKASNYALTMKDFIEKAEAFFAPEKEAANKLHKMICAKENAILVKVRPAYKFLKDRIAMWQDAQNKKREEEEKKRLAEAKEKEEKDKEKLLDKAVQAEASGDTEKAEELVEAAENHTVAPKPVTVAPPPRTGVAVAYDVDVFVEKQALVPDQYKTVDVQMLRRLYKASKYTLQVAGVRFVKRPVGRMAGGVK